MPTPIYLIQRFSDGSSSTETRYVRHTAIMDGHSYRNALLDEIPTWVSTFPEPQVVVPVGNVPFVQAWAQAVGKHLPNPETYPDALRPFLHRRVEHKTLEEALAMQHGFIKPVQVKTFDGFVLGNQTEHAQEQMGLCQVLPPDTPVWWSDPVRFGAEFRCYFANTTTLLGTARYDDGEEDVDILEHLPAVQHMATALAAPYPFSLDVGFLDNGKLALVEYNDAWALGLYQGMDPALYTSMLTQRWESLEGVRPANEWSSPTPS